MTTLRRTPRHDLLREILVTRRDKIGMTQIDLAAALRRPQSLVSRTEQGERRLDVIEFVEWCEALGCQAADVLTELGRREPPPSPTKRDGRRKRPTPS
jgi:transcriptional regulator with XRE-family HTH domain